MIKNDRFLSILRTAKERQLRPRCVCFDGGLIEAFRIVAPNGDSEHWATSDRRREESARQELARQMFSNESYYHRQLKQCCGIEQA